MQNFHQFPVLVIEGLKDEPIYTRTSHGIHFLNNREIPDYLTQKIFSQGWFSFGFFLQK